MSTSGKDQIIATLIIASAKDVTHVASVNMTLLGPFAASRRDMLATCSASIC